MSLAGTRAVLSDGAVLSVWVGLIVLALVVLVRDLRRRNAHLAPLMKGVWALSVAYSGLILLAVYWTSGRKEIGRDSVWRRAARSTAHCYSGCGAGEIIGIALAVGVLGLGNVAASAITFLLAYLFGYGMTVGPLVQGGMPLAAALRDAAYTETGSIVAMEATAIAVDLWLAGVATMSQVLFWSSLFVFLSLGFCAAYPVNVLLVVLG